MPDRWKELFQDITNILKKKLVIDVDKHFKISVGGMIERPGYHVEKSQIQMAELPFKGTPQDCYLVSRWGATPYYQVGSRRDTSYVVRHETYTEDLGSANLEKDRAIQLRQATHTNYSEPEETLLRPGAYAGVLMDSSKKINQELIDDNVRVFDIAPAREIIQESFKASTNKWKYLSEKLDATGQDSIYAKTVDRFMDKLAYEIANSKYFETEEMSFLGNRVSEVKIITF